MPAWITSLLRDDVTVPMPLGRLQDDDLAAGLRQPPRDRKADHSRADDDALNFVHFAVQLRDRAVRQAH